MFTHIDRLTNDDEDITNDDQMLEETKSLECLKKQLQEHSNALEKLQLLAILGQLKVLSRKQHIRRAIGNDGLTSLIKHLSNWKHMTKIAAEGANVILNVCYEKENVDIVVESGGTKMLVEFLSSDDEELQANAAGALQSICFQPEGRRVVRSFGAIPLLIKLLEIPSVNVKARAVGALHNMSSDVYAIRVIRRKGGIRSLVKLLSSDHPKVCGSAAGALQNVSREIVSRLIIRESQARSLLVGLLSNSEVQVQVSAAGALLNVLGPEMNQTCASHDMDRKSRELERKRKAFVRAMTSMLIANIIHDACFASCPSKISYSSHLLKRASETVSKSQDAISTAAL